MITVTSIDHPLYGEMSVFSDENGVFLEEHKRALPLLEKLQSTYNILASEEIKEISKLNLLRFAPNMYSQCFRSPPTSISEEELQEYLAPAVSSKEERRKREGYVYFIKYGNDVKIGKTVDVETRLSHLTKSLPGEFALIHTIKTNDYSRCEKNFHDKYKEKRGSGEWFSLNDKDIEEIKKIDEIVL